MCGKFKRIFCFIQKLFDEFEKLRRFMWKKMDILKWIQKYEQLMDEIHFLFNQLVRLLYIYLNVKKNKLFETNYLFGNLI